MAMLPASLENRAFDKVTFPYNTSNGLPFFTSLRVSLGSDNVRMSFFSRHISRVQFFHNSMFI